MEQEIQQQIDRKNQNIFAQNNEEDLQNSDEFDPLRSSELKKSLLKESKKESANQEQQTKQLTSERLLNIEPYSSRVSLHKQYPALSRQLRQKESQNAEDIEEAQNVQFKEQRHIDFKENEPDQETQFKESIVNLQEKKKSEEKFQKYLNQQIGHMLLNDLNGKSKLTEALQSPISFPRNISQRSGDTSFYDPQKYSLNLSRSYLPNFLSLGNPTVYEFSPVESKQSIERKLKQIFDYYSETYLQPTKCYETFDSVKKRTMGFQSFCLFAKDFKILKTIFSLQTIKKVYKKQSEYGKVLQLQNFINLVEALSHEQECNTYFRLEITVPNMNAQTRQQLQTRQLYAFMGLHEDMEKIREKFSKVFHPFGCKKDVELPRLKFNYRRFSEPDLHKKALPEIVKKEKKKNSVIVIKSKEKYEQSPLDQQKSVVVSWQILKSKTTYNLDNIKFFSNKVKKYIKQDPEDKVYLKEYKEPKSKSSIPRSMIEKKINDIQKMDTKEKKTHKVIENLEKMEQKILASKLKIQKKLNLKNI